MANVKIDLTIKIDYSEELRYEGNDTKLAHSLIELVQAKEASDGGN